MQPSPTTRTIAYIVLCASPAVITAVVAPRALRVPVVANVVGVLVFGTVATCAWMLSRPPATPGLLVNAPLRAAGLLMLAPFALFGLFWVGLGTPFESTPAENELRYSVLLAAAIAITIGFVFLKDALAAAGETILGTVGFTCALLSGAAYVAWNSFQLGYWVMRTTLQTRPEAAMIAMNNVMDAQLFAAGGLAYAGIASFAGALGAARLLGRRSAMVYVILNLVALAFLFVRGVTFPVPGAGSDPWYLQPGFIVGIPAMPWLMPFFLGAVLLRRSGSGTPPMRDVQAG